MKFRHSCLTAALLAISATAGHAALTYVDADIATNTSPGAAVTGVVAQDNLWAQRAFGTNGTVFESSGNGGPEDAPLLQTLITGLIPGQAYNVWVNFYDVVNDSVQNWNIRAGFSAGGLTVFANGTDGGATALAAQGAVGAGLASAFTYTNVTPPRFDDGGNRFLLAGSLGPATADGGGNITVFIDDLPATIGANNRTWYDGVSYEVVPEPSTALLGLIGALGLLRRRR